MDDVLRQLSRRERQVFKLLILGHSNGEIAEHLELSVRTIETHRANMQRKLGLVTRSALVELALDRGYFADLEAVAP
jgi:two-component system response regulator NreC